jgi:Domain of unknown function (DUF4282)
MSTSSPATERGFFRDLFDFSFTRLVTPRLVRVLYAITLALLVLVYIGIAIAIFSGGGGSEFDVVDGRLVRSESEGNTGLGILWLLVLGPIALFLYTLLYRVFFEILVVFFRIYENTRDQLALTRTQSASAPSTPTGPPPESTPGL